MHNYLTMERVFYHGKNPVGGRELAVIGFLPKEEFQRQWGSEAPAGGINSRWLGHSFKLFTVWKILFIIRISTWVFSFLSLFRYFTYLSFFDFLYTYFFLFFRFRFGFQTKDSAPASNQDESEAINHDTCTERRVNTDAHCARRGQPGIAQRKM